MSRSLILIQLVRGGLAIVLGILLLFWPDKSEPFLFNIMGVFWLSVGILTLRGDRELFSKVGKRTALAAGLVGIVTGLLVVTSQLTRQWLDEEVFFFLLGLVILATGLMHLLVEIRIGGITKNVRTGVHFLLSLFEVLLGVLLIMSPSLEFHFVYWAATAWAFLYGALTMGTAVYQYRHREKEVVS
ncbi:MAG: DUF308 domain-containing protein [Anaerolineae bacterium]|nr:DUF308 domain-containing protein [Anaerolineae bacterium]